MQRLVMQIRFHDHAEPPSGSPPTFAVRGESRAVTVLDGDASAAPDRARYTSAVTLTGESTFTETAVITFTDDADRLVCSSVQEGTLEPSADPELHQGSVMWRIDSGTGRLEGASGLITSNFAHNLSSGEADEFQLVSLYLP